MTRLRIGLLFGGRSGEHEVSILSARSIHEALDRERYDVLPIGITRAGAWRLGDSERIFENVDDVRKARISEEHSREIVPLPQQGGTGVAIRCIAEGRELGRVDVFLPIVHGTDGEDGAIQGYLRMLDVPFVGADVTCSALAMDKDLSKRVLVDAGLAVARHAVARVGEAPPSFAEVSRTLGEDLFVKPANLGSSVGVRRVRDEAQYDDAVREALAFDTKAVIEETIPGREIECAVLGNESPEASLPGEIVPRHEFYSYEAKYVDPSGAELHIPAPLDEATSDRVREAAVRTFRALGCEGLARVDLFLREDGSLVVNEVNTLPGFTKISMYPKLWEITGISYSELIKRLLELAEQRFNDRKLLETDYNESI